MYLVRDHARVGLVATATDVRRLEHRRQRLAHDEVGRQHVALLNEVPHVVPAGDDVADLARLEVKEQTGPDGHS